MSEEVAEFCVLKKIKLWLLKPFSTHVKQPLDVSTFEPSFKVYLFQKIRVWQSKNPGDTLSRYLVILEAGYPALVMVFSDPDLVIHLLAIQENWNPARFLMKILFLHQKCLPKNEEIHKNKENHKNIENHKNVENLKNEENHKN